MTQRMLYANDRKCVGVTSGVTGKSYNADKQGFLHVDDRDVKSLLSSGDVIMAGGMPRVEKYWHCESCNWDSNINHCRYCDSTNLTKVVK